MIIAGRVKYLIILIVLAFLGWMVLESLTQPGVTDLKGHYQQIAFVRNENNTGPVVRVYAVAVGDTLFEEMQQYGNYMPHTKYGTTKVYFFLSSQPAPTELSLEGDHVAPPYQANCVAKYEKDAMGQVSLVKYPFINR